VTAETTKHPVRTQITRSASATLSPVPSNTLSRPPVICSAPRPSEVADPNSVAKIATTSIAFPGARPAASPINGRNVAEIKLPYPLR
jgi:hypothetical protein